MPIERHGSKTPNAKTMNRIYGAAPSGWEDDRFGRFAATGTVTDGRAECHAGDDDAEREQRRGCDNASESSRKRPF